MFLMTVKQLMKFFFFLSMLNIPCYLFYHQVNHGAEPEDIVAHLAKLTLGSVGEQETVCRSTNAAASSSLELECPSNSEAFIDELLFVGITKNDSTTCRSATPVVKTDAVLQKGCFFDVDTHVRNEVLQKNMPADKEFLQDRPNVLKFKTWLEKNCLGRNKCTIPIDKMLIRNDC